LLCVCGNWLAHAWHGIPPLVMDCVPR